MKLAAAGTMRSCGGGAGFGTEMTLKAAPRLVAAEFIDVGLMLSSHRPVSSRWIRVWKAVMVSAGLKVQWPARCTNTWRSMLLSPALLTTLAYAFSSVTSTRPSPVVCMVSTGILRLPLYVMYLVMYARALGLVTEVRGAAFSVSSS